MKTVAAITGTFSALLLAATALANPAAVVPPTQTPTPTPIDYPSIVGRIQTETEAIWGHKLSHPTKPVVLDKTALTALLGKLLAEELEDPGNQARIGAMRLLDLFPEEDAGDVYKDLLSGQVGGLYNPEDKSLYVVDAFDPTGFVGGVILSHEITHALQDDAYDLDAYALKIDDMDKRVARHAVVEGDATILMIDWGRENFTSSILAELPKLFGQQMADLNSLPPALVQDLIFPYIGGSQFLTSVMQSKGPQWRRHVFTDPPSSTEQILHPEKYLDANRDEPKTVTLEPPTGWTVRQENTMGEWAIRLFLTPPNRFPRMGMFTVDPLVKEPVAVKAAAGWEGDRLLVLAQDDTTTPTALAWRIEWETETDAREFHAALYRRLTPPVEPGTPQPTIPAEITTILRERNLRSSYKGTATTLTVGLP